MSTLTPIPQAAAATRDDALTKAAAWFAAGERVPFDLDSRTISTGSESVHVWRRVVRGESADANAVWTTFLPGFPDGSIGWARVDEHLRGDGMAPKLFVEYVGQGDSDKPAKYPYGSMERADLIEALWQAEGSSRPSS